MPKSKNSPKVKNILDNLISPIGYSVRKIEPKNLLAIKNNDNYDVSNECLDENCFSKLFDLVDISPDKLERKKKKETRKKKTQKGLTRKKK